LKLVSLSAQTFPTDINLSLHKENSGLFFIAWSRGNRLVCMN